MEPDSHCTRRILIVQRSISLSDQTLSKAAPDQARQLVEINPSLNSFFLHFCGYVSHISPDSPQRVAQAAYTRRNLLLDRSG